MNLIKSFFNHQYFVDVQTIHTTTKPKKISSHLYLDRIKHLKEEHNIALLKKDEIISKRNEKIESLENQIKSLNIALSMKTFREVSENIEKKKSNATVNRNTLANFSYLKKDTLQYVLGHRAEDNSLIISDLSKDPHVLISGKTGSGKSITTFNVLMSITYSNTPKTLKISLIDPKLLSFGDKRVISSPFLNEKPSIGDNEQALKILQNAYKSMMKRYKIMLDKGVKNYRKIGLHAHVIFIDEVFELLEGDNAKEILSLITRIASLGRAGGVHLVLATQSPRAKTLSGTLKANLEFIGLKMSNSTESNLIGFKDAHKLRGEGDGYREIEGEIVRFQATYLDEEMDESYATLNPAPLSRLNNPAPPLHEPCTSTLHPESNADIQAITALAIEVIKTVDEKGKIKPRSYFFSKRTKKNDRLWTNVLNCLHKEKEIIYHKKGVGYFLAVDYNTALSILES